MENLQIPHSLRPLRSDDRHGHQSPLQSEAGAKVSSLPETKVVEWPAHLLQKDLIEDATATGSPRKRKSSNGKRRKEVAISIQSKSAQVLRQVREGSDSLSVEELKRLEAYADRINQLIEKRASRRQQEDGPALKHNAEQVQQLLTEMTASLQTDNVTTPPLKSSPPPQDWQRSEQEAEKAAQVLRQLNHREPVNSDFARPPNSRPTRFTHRASWQNRWSLKVGQLLQVPAQPIDRLGDAMLWAALAAVVRVGGKLLTAAHPVFGPLALLLMIAPAAIALFLACSAPRAGVISFYRLFLIMLGFVIGGKL
ncbi:MAG TPA: hypothetical protein V6C46_05275 [Coleofasciculaceae cyanobacterium]